MFPPRRPRDGPLLRKVREFLFPARLRRGRLGLTLVELLVAISIISIGMLGFTGSFRFITHSIRDARAKSLALSLAQEKVENLKNTPYHKLQISTQVVTYTNVTPNQICDEVNYPPETIRVGGITFTRCVYISLTRVNDHVVDELSALYPDSGLKWVEVTVMWDQRGSTKRLNLNNLHENPNVQPLNATVKGAVTDSSGSPIPGAVVTVLDKADWEDATDAAGSYLFQVNEGSYFIRASSAGYHDLVYSSVTVAEADILTTNFFLTPIATGTVSGNVFYSSHLVIAQVVLATTTRIGDAADPLEMGDVEYVMLFNPTTFTINMTAASSSPGGTIYYRRGGSPNTTHTYNDMMTTLTSTFVPPNKGYLIANASWFLIADTWVRADASYGAGLNYLDETEAGSVIIYRWSDSFFVDRVAWGADGVSEYNGWYDGTPLADSACADGIGQGNLIIRYSSPTTIADSGVYAWAYDSGNNTLDFAGPHVTCAAGLSHPLMNWSDIGPIRPYSTFDSTQTVIGGLPAYGALVTANDLIGGTTNAYLAHVTNDFGQSQPYARFQLNGVSTGTWTVLVATKQFYSEISGVVVPNLGGVSIPNSVTEPAEPGAGVHIVRTTQPAIGGYVNGLVRNANGAALAGIAVIAGGTPVTTSSNGRYFAAVATGSISVVINANYANASYQESVQLVDVEVGELLTVSADLSERGVVMGYVTSDGNSVLPNIQVTASRSGQQFGAATSDSSGNFYFRNLTTGTYQIEPTLDPLEIWSPSSYTAVAVAGATVHVGTFVITGAQSMVTGSVMVNGELVTTGALILISTGVIPATPPAIVASSAAAQTVIYSGSSKADGTYEIEVRGSTTTTYRVSAFVPVISGDAVTISTKSYSGVVVTSTGGATRDIVIP